MRPIRIRKLWKAKEYLVVGVNAFEVEEEIDLDKLEVDPRIEQQQQERLAATAHRAGC